MKKKILAIALSAIILFTAVFASGCTGCFSDTTTTGTKYTFSLIGNIDADYDGHTDEATFERACWDAIKKVADNRNSQESEKWYYKYYPVEEINVKEGESYLALYEAAAKKQLELAIASKAKERATIIIPAERYTSAYTSLKDKLDGVNTVLVGVSRDSEYSKQSSLATQTYAIVIDYALQGYMSGYTAVCDGYTKLGFIGYENAMSKSMLMGYMLGAEAAGTEKNVNVELKYEYVINAQNSDDTINMIKDMYSACDIVMTEDVQLEKQLEQNAGEKAFISTSGAYADKAVFSYAVDHEKLAQTVEEKIKLSNISAEVETFSVFTYKCDEKATFTKADGEELIKNTKSPEYGEAVTDIATLIPTLKQVKASKLSEK